MTILKKIVFDNFPFTFKKYLTKNYFIMNLTSPRKLYLVENKKKLLSKLLTKTIRTNLIK